MSLTPMGEAVFWFYIVICLFFVLLTLWNIIRTNGRNKERYQRLKKAKTPITKVKFNILRRKKKNRKEKPFYSLICKNPLCRKAIYFYYDYCIDCLLKETDLSNGKC